jgi:tetratricopeptide (TPR) repeat protein
MAIKGSLKEAGLTDVCQLLALSFKTGCLSVTDRARFGQVFFDRGRITFARVVNRRDRLGDMLVREGAITEDQLRDVVEEQARRADRRLGELLLERGFIESETLVAVLRRQIEEAVHYLFTWRRGSFHFEPGLAPDAGEMLTSLNVETLLLDAAGRIDEWEVIETKIPSLDLVFALDRPRLDAAQVRIAPEQELLLPLLDGRRSVHEVAELAGIDELTTTKAVFGLVQAGFLRRVEVTERAAGDPAGDSRAALNLAIAFYRTSMLDDAEREFRRALQHDPGDTAASHYLALLALRRGEPARAERRLRALLEVDRPRVATYLNLAGALRIQGQHGDAVQVLEDARLLAPEDGRITLALAATRLFAGDADSALSALEQYRAGVHAGDTPPAAFYYCAGLARAVMGDFAGAEVVTEEGLVAHADSAPLHLLRGHVAEIRADMVEAERSYRTAAEADPELPQCHRNLGDQAYRRGALQEAADHYGRATELDPDLGDDVYARLADLHYRRNERDQAIRCWRRAIELNPGNVVARSRLEVVAGASA